MKAEPSAIGAAGVIRSFFAPYGPASWTRLWVAACPFTVTADTVKPNRSRLKRSSGAVALATMVAVPESVPIVSGRPGVYERARS